MKRQKATFLITLEWTDDMKRYMTPQVARDKLLTPLQELWILRTIDKFSIEEIEQLSLSMLSRGAEAGQRESFYDQPPVLKKGKKKK